MSAHPPPSPASPASGLVPGLSRAQVAKNLGLSETRVAQIEARALLKLRLAMLRRGYGSLADLLKAISPPQT